MNEAAIARKYHWKGRLWHIPYSIADARQNARWCGKGPRFLVVRHGGKHPSLQQYYLDWLAREFPEIRSLFELRLLPCQVRDWSKYCLYIPWCQDPAIDWMTPGTYARALQLEAECNSRGIPVINSVADAANCIRSVAAEKLTAAGIRTPRVVTITDPARFRLDLGGLSLPLIVRDDRGHGKRVVLVKSRSDLDAIRFDQMRHPIGVQFIDVSQSDGLYRKCRFVAAGDAGVRRHLIVSRHWEVRAEKRVAGEDTRREELEFLQSAAEEHALLDRARRCLQLQWAAFDYSFDVQGELLVWETNAYPNLSFPPAAHNRYTHPYVERSLAAMTRMYLTAADLPVPDEIERRMNLNNPAAVDLPRTSLDLAAA